VKGDPVVLEQLNRALRHELTASSQFWLHYRLLHHWGFGKLAAKWRKEAIEEMEHADCLIERIVFLEGHPNLQELDPLVIGETPREVLDCDLRAEYGARTIYRAAREVARQAGDQVSKLLIDRLLEDEEAHIDFLETQIDLHEAIGAERYGLLNADPAEEADEDD
jgi:bacterioferritin